MGPEPDLPVLARWAADCAERVLACFEDVRPDDDRPRQAVEAARAWARGEISVGSARSSASAAHDAASDTDPAAEAARAAARAAGYAAATAYLAEHAAQAARYALKAVTYAAEPGHAASAMADERDWQRRMLPANLRSVLFPEDG